MKIIQTPTQSGNTRYIVSGKNAPVTFRKCIELAKMEGHRVKWGIDCKAIYAQNDYAQARKAYLTTRHSLTGQDLLDQIDNPRPGDNWKPGDIRKALISITTTQHNTYITSIRDISKITLWTE